MSLSNNKRERWALGQHPSHKTCQNANVRHVEICKSENFNGGTNKALLNLSGWGWDITGKSRLAGLCDPRGIFIRAELSLAWEKLQGWGKPLDWL